MYWLFKKNGSLGFEEPYTDSDNSIIVKNILDKIVFSKDKFEVNFIADDYVEFKRKMNKPCSLDAVAKNTGFIVLCKGSFRTKRNKDGKLSIEYHLDNGFYMKYATIISVLLVLGFGYLAFQDLSGAKQVLLILFFFESFIWCSSLMMFSIIPCWGFINILKSTVEEFYSIKKHNSTD